MGNSAAAVAAVETLRRLGGGGDHRITVVADEPVHAYARCLLPDVLAGKRSGPSIALRPAGFYRRLGVDLLAGVAAVELRPGEKVLVLRDGREVGYDRLLVATGAAPVLPELPGVEREGVFTLRTLGDVQGMAALLPRVRLAVVAGGGLVGLKAAYALKEAGVERVTVAVASPRLLTRQLDEEAAAMVEKELAGMGLEFVYNARPAAFAGDSRGALAKVALADGRELPAELALVAKGVRPNTALVERAGGRTGRGIVVDARLRTTLEDVFAAGDCIEVTDRLTGRKTNSALWTLASEQGRCAAANMLGRASFYPPPLTRLNSARFGSVNVISAGELEGTKVLARYDAMSNTYRRFVFAGERLAGFILAGRVVDGAGVYTALVKSGRPARHLAGDLMEGRAGPAAVRNLFGLG